MPFFELRMERNDAALDAALPGESRFLDSLRSLGMTSGFARSE
jgi:hypothetical protein